MRDGRWINGRLPHENETPLTLEVCWIEIEEDRGRRTEKPEKKDSAPMIEILEGNIRYRIF